MSHHEVIVIGVGCMGSAACAALANRGVKVLGLERGRIPHDQGSSGHQSRAFRLAYYEHADYVPLLKASHDGWLQLNAMSKEPVFLETGGLYMGHEGCDFVELAQAAAVTHGLEFERLDANQIREQFPAFDAPGDFIGLLEKPAGMIIPERAIAAQAAGARQHGADLREGVTVHSWDAHRQGIRVETDAGTFTSDQLVLCAGAWAPQFCPGLPLRISRQVLGWVDPPRPELLQEGTLPVWAIELPDATVLYGFPMVDGLPGPDGFKLARHWPAETCDPGTVDRSPRPGDAEDFMPHMKRFLPAAVGPVTNLKICLYTNTPDVHFIIDKLPGEERVTIATGFSGHGFKFQPAVGNILADLVVSGRTQHPIGFLGLDRFGDR